MASLFNITTAGSNIVIDRTRQGRASFTVANVSPRGLRGYARVTIDDPLAQSWLTIEGSAARIFALNATEQYTIVVTLPPDAEQKDYTFRLIMVEESNPDDNFTEGPSVGLKIPPPLPPKSPFPWWIIPLAIIVVVLLALVLFGSIGITDTLRGPTRTVLARTSIGLTQTSTVQTATIAALTATSTPTPPGRTPAKPSALLPTRTPNVP